MEEEIIVPLVIWKWRDFSSDSIITEYSEITCAHCGGTSRGIVVNGKGIHKYKVECGECGAYYKWASEKEIQGMKK